MATSIGTAWIQIKPSLRGVSNDIKAALGDSGRGASDRFGKNFKSSFLAASKASFQDAFSEFGARSDAAFSQFKTLAMSAGVALSGALTYAVKQFADREQLVGGIETLFGAGGASVEEYAKKVGKSVEQARGDYNKLMSSQNMVLENSKKAYQTAQLSANEYMETATSFSASLLQGLGGDTVQAAKIADLAIIDMADNANKMGTSMQSIQWAYQGFAKQNYTMLDNLKLGYGGTASEMARLINDTGVMGKGFKATAENMKEVPFNKVIEGIHKVQEKMGITGTSAKEASQTISGSFNMAKAAFNNMIVSMGDPEGDFKAEMNKFLEAAKTFLGNLKPVIKNIAGTVFDEIKEQSPELANDIKMVADTMRGMLKFVSEHKELVLTIGKAVLAYKALQVAVGGTRSAMSTLSPFYKLFRGTIQGAIGGGQTLIDKIKTWGTAKKEVDNTTKSFDGFNKTVERTPKTFSFGESFKDFFKNIGQVLSGALDMILQPLKTLAQGATDIFKTVLKGAGEGLAGMLKALANPQLLLGAVVLAAGAGAIALAIWAIGSAIGAVSPALGDFLNTVIIPLGTFLLGVLVVALTTITILTIRLTNEAVIPLVNAVSGGLTQAFNSIGGVITSAGNAISNVVNSITGGIANVINSVANLLRSVGGQDWYGTGYGITRNFSAGIIDGLVDLLQDSLNNIINAILGAPGVGNALKAAGVKNSPINLRGFRLGRRAQGGAVFGPGSDTSDSIPMALSNGEYVIRAAAARKIGYKNLDSLNATGNMSKPSQVIVNINGYNKDPEVLADEVSKKIALKRRRVIG